MRRIIFFILAVSFISIYPQDKSEAISSQTNNKDSLDSAKGAMTLSLNEALSLAMQKNKDILISRQDLDKAEAQINEAYGNALPQVSLSANYSRNIQSPVLFLPPGTPFNTSGKTLTLEMGAKNSFTSNIAVNQVLFSAKVNTAIKIAKDYRKYSEFNAAATNEEIVLAVKKAYYGALMTRKVVDVSQQSLQLAKANFENVSLLYKQGMASEFDFLRSQVQVANTEPMVSQSQNSQVLALNALRNLLGIPFNRLISLTGSLEMDLIPESLVDTLSQSALERSNTILGLMAQESILEKNIQIQKADYYPTLAAFGQYQYQSQDNTFNLSNWLWAKSFVVGLQVSYPLFSGLQTKYRTEQAVIEKSKLTLTRQKAEDGIRIQVEEARLRMIDAKQRVASQAKSVEQATKAVSIAEVRFKNGLGTQIELIDSQVALTRTQINQVQATYDYLVARADWEKAAGFNK